MISQSKTTKSEYKYKLNSETVPLLAGADADGVVPGLLVLKAPDPVEALA